MSPSEQVYPSAAAPTVSGRPGSGPAVDGASRVAAAPETTSPPAYDQPGYGAARPAPAATSASSPAPSSAPRKVRLTLARIDPWSVLKLSFLLSVAMGIGMVTASIILWGVVNSMGVLDELNRMLRDIAGGDDATFDLYQWVGLGRVVSLSTFLGVINIIIIMALSTLGAFLYNIAATLVGGLQVTLSDD